MRIERSSSRVEAWEERLDKPLLVVALLFTVALLEPMIRELPDWAGSAATVINVAAWFVFAGDYAVRLALSPQRWLFVRRHPGDLAIVVLPLLRPLRLLRVIRVLRLGVLLHAANERAQRSLHGRVVTYVLGVTIAAVVLASLGVWTVERHARGANIKTLPDGLWWSFTTITTVGYGDRFPVTPQGRLIAVGLMLTGIALLGVITASIAAWFVGRLQIVEAAELRTDVTLERVLKEVQELRAELRRLTEPSARLDR
jgi:voltage-gated potassium channel